MKRIGAGFAVIAASALLMLGAARAAPPDLWRVDGNGVVPALITTPASENADLFEWLGEAAENGNVEVMNLLGVLYVGNAKVPTDYSMALYWFQRAVDRGSADAMHNMAYMYLRGIGVSRDYANAFSWFQRAAEGGNAFAMHSVAAMAEHGLGTTRDVVLARSMYRKAAESGILLSMMWLSEDLARAGPNRNLVEAHAWLEVAALAELDGQLQVIVLGRMEDLGNQLGPVGRDKAHSQAARIVVEIRVRAAARAASQMQLSPAPNRRIPSA
jgi:TPR repeat protein